MFAYDARVVLQGWKQVNDTLHFKVPPCPASAHARDTRTTDPESEPSQRPLRSACTGEGELRVVWGERGGVQGARESKADESGWIGRYQGVAQNCSFMHLPLLPFGDLPREL